MNPFDPQSTATAADEAAPKFAHQEPLWLSPVSFWPRAGARIIDILVVIVPAFIMGVLVAIILAVLATVGIIDAGWEDRMDKATLLSKILFALALVAYHAASEAIGGATIGKLALGLRVCSPDGTACTVGGAIIRSFAFLIDQLFFGIVAYSKMSKSPLAQRFGDDWGNTVVVRASSLPTRAPGGRVALGIVVGLAMYCAVAFVTLLIDAF